MRGSKKQHQDTHGSRQAMVALVMDPADDKVIRSADERGEKGEGARAQHEQPRHRVPARKSLGTAASHRSREPCQRMRPKLPTASSWGKSPKPARLCLSWHTAQTTQLFNVALLFSPPGSQPQMCQRMLAPPILSDPHNVSPASSGTLQQSQ